MSKTARPPLLERQAVYWSTGAVAGIASLLSISAASSLGTYLVPSTSVTSPAIRHAVAGAGMRFLAFDLAKEGTKDKIANAPLRGGISGCIGGLAETLQAGVLSSISTRSLAPLRPSTIGPSLLSHGGTLFLCFGGYTLLSTSLYEKQPPPIPMTFLLGGIAGAVGVPLATCIKNGTLRGVAGLATTGFVRVGTVIGVQVSAVARVLDWLETNRL